MVLRKSQEEYIREVHALVGNEYSVVGEYIGAKDKIEIKHNKCGNVSSIEASSFLCCPRCPICSLKEKTLKHTKTNEQFINEVAELVGDEYTFLEKYINTEYKIQVRHNMCGYKYKIRPANFLKGRRCPKCAKEIRANKQRKSQKEFCDKIKELTGEEYSVIGKYISSSTKIRIRHNCCGYIFSMIPNNFINHNQRCPECMSKQAHETQTRTHEEFLKAVEALVGSEYSVVSQYRKSVVNLLMRHNKCGHIYSVRPNNFIAGKRCPECAKKITAYKRTVKIEDYKKQLHDIFGDEYNVLTFKSMKDKALILHNACEKTHLYAPYDLLTGTICVYCGKIWRKTHEYFLNEVKSLVGDEYTVLSEYTGANNYVLMRHNKCGHKYDVEPANFLYGKRCPACMESTGERTIASYLKRSCFGFVRQYKFNDCKSKNVLRFDFAVFDKSNHLKCLIEYDGRQHFEPIEYFGGKKALDYQKKRDKIKDTYCKDNNIPLVRIPYMDIDNINNVLEKCLF